MFRTLTGRLTSPSSQFPENVPVKTSTATDGSCAPGYAQLYTVSDLVQVIPNMTGTTFPSGTASSSQNFSGFSAWMAFTSAARAGAGSPAGWVSANVTWPIWIQYQFLSGVTAVAYDIAPWYTDNFPGRSPTSWTFSGSNNGSAFTTLDTQTSVAPWIYKTPTRFTITTPASYTYYRLNMTANSGANLVGVGVLGIYTSAQSSSALQLNAIDSTAVNNKYWRQQAQS